MLREWRAAKLVEVAAKKRWALNGGPFGSKLSRKHYSESGVPVIRGTNLPSDCKFSFDDFVFVSEEKADELLANNAHPGNLVFTQRGTIGQIGLIPADSRFRRFVISQSQMKLTVDSAVADALFLHYFFSAGDTVQKIQNLAFAAGVPHINLDILRNFEVPVPPLPVQQRIAGILSAYDELIENSQRRIRILETMARALYREWFVHFRFPGHEHHPRVASPLGEIPQGWEVARLETICEKIVSGGTPRTSANEYWGGGVPWLSSGETGNAFIIETDMTITEEGVSNSSTRFARSGCTVVASAGQGKTRGQTSMLCVDCYINQSTIALTADANQITDNLLFFDLSGRYSQLRQISDGSSRGSLTTRLLADLEVIVPPTSLVREFDAIVAPIVKSIGIALRANKNLRRTRDLLLPRLLSGQVAVDAISGAISDSPGGPLQ